MILYLRNIFLILRTMFSNTITCMWHVWIRWGICWGTNFLYYMIQFWLLQLYIIFTLFIKLYSNVAACKWGTAYPILQKIIDIETTTTIDNNNYDHGEYILIGTIYKEMSLRGSVLDEFKENNGITGECRVWFG